MIGGVRLLGLRALRRQPGRAVLAAVAVAAGVCLSAAVLVQQHSFTASLDDFGRQLAGPAALRVSGPILRGGLAASVLPAVRGTAGVRAAVPVVQTVTIVENPAGRRTYLLALGVDCSVQAVIGDFGCSEQAVAGAKPTDPPVVSARLLERFGPGAVVRTDVGRIPLAGAVSAAQLDAVNHGRVAVFALPQAQQVFGRQGRLDAIYVVPRRGVPVPALRARLQHTVGAQNSVSAAESPPGQAQDAGLLIPQLGLIALLALGIGVLLVSNVVTLSLAERRRELAVASALGGTRRLLVTGALAEAAVIGLAGGVLGTAASVLVARPLVASVSELAEELAGAPISVHLSALPLAVGVLLGVAVSTAAAALPAWRASRLDVAAELHDRGAVPQPARRTRGRRALGWLVVGWAGVAASELAGWRSAIHPWQPPLGIAGELLAVIGFFAAVASVAPLLLQSMAEPATRLGGLAAVAVRNLAGEPRRTGVMALAVALAAGLSTLLAGASTGTIAVSRIIGLPQVNGRVFVSTIEPNNAAALDANVSPAVEQALARVPGVASVGHNELAQYAGSSLIALAIDGGRLSYHVVAGTVSQAALGRGEVFIGPALARERHLRPGDSIRLATPTGFVRLPVAAIWNDPDNIGHGVTMSVPTLHRLYGPQPPYGLYATPEKGVSPKELAARIQGAHLDPDLTALPPEAFVATLAHSVQRLIAPFYVVQRALFGVTLIATLATLLIAGVQRRRELGVLAAVGLGPSQLARLTVLEAGLVGVIGSVLGILAGIGVLVAGLADGIFLYGARPPFDLPVEAALASAAIAIVVVVAGAGWPAWRTSRLQIARALRYE